MSYFAMLLDKDFKSLSSGLYSQYPVSSFDLVRKAQEFDSMTVSFKKMENSKNGVYVGIYDQFGKLFYLSLCGIPQTSGSLTTVNAVDIRRVLNQEIYFSQTECKDSCASTYSVANYYKYVLSVPKSKLTSSYLGTDYDVDISMLVDSFPYVSGGEYDMSLVADGEDKVRNIWTMLQEWNSKLGIVVVAVFTIAPDEGKNHITLTAVPINRLMSFSLDDMECSLSYSTTKTNMARVFRYDMTLYGVYHLLSNNDISETVYSADGTTVASDNLGSQYTNDDTFGRYNGQNQYLGTYRNAYLSYPCICKDYIQDCESTDSADDQEKALTAAVANAKKSLSSNRFSDSVEISIDAALPQKTFSVLFTDESGNEREFYYPFEVMAKVNGYSNADKGHFKLLPVSKVETKFSSSGKIRKSITFGYLSDYAWLKGI